ELSAPAREQIHAWLSETSTASSGENWRAFLRQRDKQADDGAATEKLVIWQEMRVPSMQLVPIERHRAQTRWQFLRGVLVGFGICAVVMIPIFRYAGGTKPGSPALTTASANRAAQSSVEQTRASVAQPVSPSASISEPTATKPRATVPAALQQLWSALQAGNMNAAVALADLYTRGEGVPVNCEQARILLLVASEKNNAEASKKLQGLDKGGCPANSE